MAQDSVLKFSQRWLFYTFAWILIFIIIFPLFWMVVTSLKPQTELFVIPPSFFPDPTTMTLEHYKRLLFKTPFATYFRNSAFVSTITTLLVIAVATLGAHSIVKFRYRGRSAVAQLILFTYLLPAVVLVIPIYLMMSLMGLVNSLLSLIIAYVTFALPFALWLLRSFMAAIPPDLEYAAMVDGASRMRAFIDVILPQAVPGIISTSLFTFIVTWNEYLYALILINRDSQKTLPPGVVIMLTSTFNIEWSLLMAASVIMAIPLIFIFTFLQNHLTRGFGAGAVKG